MAVKTADEAIQELERAVGAAAGQERRSQAYGRIVGSVAECLTAGVKRAKIADVIEAGLPSYTYKRIVARGDARQETSAVRKGRAARYVILARWHLGQYKDDETPIPASGLLISNRRYKSPVDALNADVTGFTAVYDLFKAHIKPQVTHVRAVAPTVKDAAQEWVERGTLRVLGEGEKAITIKVADDVQILTAVLNVVQKMLRRPAAKMNRREKVPA